MILGNELASSIDIQSDIVTTISNLYTNISGCDNNKKIKNKPKKFKSGNGLTAADMYDAGFRIENTNLCSSHTRLLVLITSAAAPSHSQNRQAIRMTWMNRYGPSVSMAFLVGTPQMSETDPVAQMLEAEEQALRIRLNRINMKNVSPKDKINQSGVVNSDSNWFPFLRERQPNQEGLNSRAMNGLNKAEQAVQRVLGREYNRYGDLIQSKSRDTYTNLTLKSIAALEWTKQYCSSARYLLKTDDDMFIDIQRLLRFIDKVETTAITKTKFNASMHVNPNELESAFVSDYDIELPPTIWGRLAHGWRPIRQHSSKYYVSYSEYADRVYPDFCTGPAYLMTRSAVNPLYEAALGKDFDIIDDDYVDDDDNKPKNNTNKNIKYLGKNCNNYTFNNNDISIGDSGKNSVPYLKLEDVYLTGVVAERLTRRAAKRQLHKEKKKNSSSGNDHKTNPSNEIKINKSKTTDIIVKINRINDDQFANKKITGKALERAVCNGISPGDTANTNGINNFSWFRWYWSDTSAVDKDLRKKKKKDPGVISIHMVKYVEQFDLWRRLMDSRTKCKS